MSFTLSGQQLLEYYYHPFPVEEGAVHNFQALAHLFALTAEVGDSTSDAGSTVNTMSRSFALSSAATALVELAQAERQVAESLDNGAAELLAKNQGSRLGRFVDGLLASPPVCEMVPPPPRQTPVVIGTVIVVIPPVFRPEPVPPEWGPDEEISPYDLFAVATRFQQAATVAQLGPMQAEFGVAAERLFEAGQERLA